MSAAGASVTTQLQLLARRSVAHIVRDRGLIVSAFVFPLVLFAIVAAGLSAATEIEGFPTDNFTSFALVIAFANGAMVMVAGAGGGIATDVESGFINRMALTPMRNSALLGAQLAGPLVLGVAQAVLYIAVGYAAGARLEAGLGGGLVLILLFLAAVSGFGALGMFVGIRTGSNQAVQALAPMTLVLLFLSSVNLPRNLIESDWFKWVATINPISYLVEGMRSLLIEGWNGEALALGFGVAAAITALGLLASARALRLRLVRT